MRIFWLCSCIFISISGCGSVSTQSDTTRQAIAGVLDSLHALAAKADGENYFALFAPDAVFFGTDAGERWTVDQFRAYAMPYFSQGRGWTYRMTRRNIYLSEDGNTAWFDEMLENARYGTCRGTGVLVRRGSVWKIAQYHLTIPIPNALANEVVQMIRAYEQENEPR